MSNRIAMFLLCAILVPVLLLTLFVVALVVLILPFAAFLKPDIVKFKD